MTFINKALFCASIVFYFYAFPALAMDGNEDLSNKSSVSRTAPSPQAKSEDQGKPAEPTKKQKDLEIAIQKVRGHASIDDESAAKILDLEQVDQELSLVQRSRATIHLAFLKIERRTKLAPSDYIWWLFFDLKGRKLPDGFPREEHRLRNLYAAFLIALRSPGFWPNLHICGEALACELLARATLSRTLPQKYRAFAKLFICKMNLEDRVIFNYDFGDDVDENRAKKLRKTFHQTPEETYAFLEGASRNNEFPTRFREVATECQTFMTQERGYVPLSIKETAEKKAE